MGPLIYRSLFTIVPLTPGVAGVYLLIMGDTRFEFVGRILLTVGVYLLTLRTSGTVFRCFVGELSHDPKLIPSGPQKTPSGCTTGTVIGKCENILTLTLILMGGYTGLAVIFAAKPIARADQIKEHPEYYLAGTLVNFTYSVLIAVLLRFALGL